MFSLLRNPCSTSPGIRVHVRPEYALEVIDEDKPDEKYALKVLASGRPAQAYERFHREISALQRVVGLHVVRVFDHSKPGDDFQYYVMELVEGAVPLKSLIEGEQEDNRFFGNALESIELFMDILIALISCHASEPKIVHRDLSPANILILPDRSIRIIDFGICQIEGSETVTLIDEGLGTRYYAAPECGPGSSVSIDSRTDLYSAGKVLWSAIASRRAFDREAPVFNNLSMKTLFLSKKPTWHLHHVFEKTIRRSPSVSSMVRRLSAHCR